MANSSFAQGGPAPLGPVKNLLQMRTGDPFNHKTTDRLYDPERDVLMFFPYMLNATVRALRDRSLPVLVLELEDPEVEAAVAQSLMALFKTIQNVSIDQYDMLVENWLADCRPEAADIVLKILGRALVQFFFECSLYVRNPGDPLPGSTMEILSQLLRSSDVRTTETDDDDTSGE